MKEKLLMKDLLEDIFYPLKKTYPDFKIIGDEATFSFDSDRYAKLSFTKYATHGTPSSNRFNGCEISIMSRTKGQLDMKRIAFEDVFENIFDQNHPNKISKHIWNDNGYRWYGTPTQKDKQDLFNAVNNYFDIFKVRETPKKSLDSLLSDAINKAMNNKETFENPVSLKNRYDNAMGFIKELKTMAETSQYLSRGNKDMDSQLIQKNMVDKLLKFDEKDLLNDTYIKNEPERE